MNTKELVTAEATLNEVSQKTKAMEEQLQQLQKMRDAVVDETRVKQAENAEYEDLTKSLKEIQESIASQEAKLFDTTEEFAKADKDLKHKVEEVERINDSIQSQQEILSTKSKEVDVLETNITAVRDEHKRLSEESTRINETIMSSRAKKMNISGDECPTGTLLCFPIDSICKRVDDMSSSSSGIPNHFEHDAPISLTGHSTQMVSNANEDDEGDTNTDAMLAAIVGDLKQFLAQASVENENRGLDKGLQTGIPLSCAA
jgi:uncharacterized phage infection (PIP) family protein YhgE